jgi:hypothetical protein
MITAWLPTPAELAALNAGAAIHVRILGQRPAADDGVSAADGGGSHSGSARAAITEKMRA